MPSGVRGKNRKFLASLQVNAAFRAFEDACDQAGGRPHWGKLHRMNAESLRARYPRFAQALAVRDALDPQRLFRNPYLTRVLGA